MSRSFIYKTRRRFKKSSLSLFKSQRRKIDLRKVEAPRAGRSPEDQIAIEVLQYRIDHPEAMVRNGNTVAYGVTFKDFLVKRFAREKLTRREFAYAAGIAPSTLRAWLLQSGALVQPVMPVSTGRKGMKSYIFADDTLTLWPSILKQNARSRLAMGLFAAVLLNFTGLVAYQKLSYEEEQVQTVRLMKYTEIVMPEIKEPPKQSWEDVVSSGRQPTAGIVARNFEVVKPREKKPGEDAEDANSDDAKVKKAGVLSMIEDNLAQDIDPALSSQAMSIGRTLSSGRSGSNGSSNNADLIGLLDGLGSTDNGKNGIDEIIKSDVAKNKPAVKLAKTGKVNVEQLGKVSGSKEALGARTEESLRKALAENMGRLQYIYNKYLKNNPEIGGKVEIEVAINPDGAVANAIVLASEIVVDDFQREIIAAIRRWKYDAITQGQVKVVYPIIFIKTS